MPANRQPAPPCTPVCAAAAPMGCPTRLARWGAPLSPLLVTAVLLLPGVAQADADRGRLLYENQCTVCHESVVHIRERRKAANAAELRAFIQRWAAELKLTWSQDEMNDVFQYLNKRYYKFPQ